MDELERLKEAGAPKLAAAKEEQNDKIETLIILVGALCDSNDEILKTNKEVLRVKKEHFYNWTKQTSKRFYIAFIGAMLTGAVLYLDVLKLDEESAIVGAVIGLINAAKFLI